MNRNSVKCAAVHGQVYNADGLTIAVHIETRCNLELIIRPDACLWVIMLQAVHLKCLCELIA